MQRVPVSEIQRHAGETVTVAGFVKSVRDQKRMQFVVVADRTGAVQATHARAGESDPLASTIAALPLESAVAVTGEVVVDPKIRMGGVEIRVHAVDVAGPAVAPSPIG